MCLVKKKKSSENKNKKTSGSYSSFYFLSQGKAFSIHEERNNLKRHQTLWPWTILNLIAAEVSATSHTSHVKPVQDASTAKWGKQAEQSWRGGNYWITELVIKGLLVHPGRASDLRMTCGLEVLMLVVTRHQGASLPYLCCDLLTDSVSRDLWMPLQLLQLFWGATLNMILI